MGAGSSARSGGGEQKQRQQHQQQQQPKSRRRSLATATAVALIAAAVVALPRAVPRAHLLLRSSDAEPLGDVGPRDCCDVAVVLGYALHRNGSCTRPLQGRVEVGVELFRRGVARNLIFSGAHPGGGERGGGSEASAMRSYARRVLCGGGGGSGRDVDGDCDAADAADPGAGGGAAAAAEAAAAAGMGGPSRRRRSGRGGGGGGRWLLEDRSTSTRENAAFTAAMVAEQRRRAKEGGSGGGNSRGGADGGGGGGKGDDCVDGDGVGGAERPWRSIVIVTNPFHQWRARRTFARAIREAGLTPLEDGAAAAAADADASSADDPALRLYVAAAPFDGHRGYPFPPLVDSLADLWDFAREVAAVCWYWARGWL